MRYERKGSDSDESSVAGFSREAVRENREKLEGLKQAAKEPRLPVRVVEFKKKFGKIPDRKSYKGKFSQSFWDKFTKVPLSRKPASWIQADKLEEMASSLGFQDMGRVAEVAETLRKGADLGCEGSARLGTKMKNAPSAFVFGNRFLDSLEDWLQDGLAAGPFTRKEVEQLFRWEEMDPNSGIYSPPVSSL